jgi:hypothetical protein
MSMRRAPRTRPVPVPARSRLPFALSAVISALLGLWGLFTLDAARRPAAAVVPSRGVEGAAFIDGRPDVAHPGGGLRHPISAAVDWLERHQYAEGPWSARSFAQMCEGRVCAGRGDDEHDLGVTALAALAILESGLPRERIERSASRALAWLAGRQDASGCFGARGGKSMYGHAIATLAFARAYPVLGEPIYKHHAARGVRFLEMARNPGQGWRYGVRDGESDTSVTAWSGFALLAAASPETDVRVDPYALEGIRRWLDEATCERTYATAYMRRGGGGASVRGMNDHFERNEGLTAMALGLRLGLGEDPARPELREAAQRLATSLPVWNSEGTSVDFSAWLAGTRALARYGDEALWKAWSGRVNALLVGRQRRFNEGCLAGSWDPADKWGAEGGRIYATAANLLTLGIVHRHEASGRGRQAPASAR